MKSAARVAVVDYGAGNLRSVAKALERTGMQVDVTDDPQVVARADGVVVPGVGAFADAMQQLRESGLEAVVKDAVQAQRPYLGLCFGLQLLFEEGDEHGTTQGLCLLRGRVERLPDRSARGERMRVPHIGWNEVRFSGNHPMLERLPERDHFYFVHSYRPVPSDPAIVVGRTEYGDGFVSAVATDSIFAVQFHPEKSQRAGERLLAAFRHWVEASR